jgi:hypothetical protein
MLEFWEFVYMCIFVLVILVLKKIIEYVFITCKGGNIINIEETVSNTKTNEIGTNTRFKKKKGGKDDKVVEGFADCQISPTHPIDDLTTNALIDSDSIEIDDSISNCERAKWLLCNNNFNKLSKLLNIIKDITYTGELDVSNRIVIDGELIFIPDADGFNYNDSIEIDDSMDVNMSNCERMTWLFSDNNFNKLLKLLNVIRDITYTGELGVSNRILIDGELIVTPDADGFNFNDSIEIDDSMSNCERSLWLFSDNNFNKLSKLLKIIKNITSTDNKIVIDGQKILG